MKGHSAILLVDSDASMRKYLRLFLSSKGYRLLESANGQDALELSQTRNPNLILMDLDLSDMRGRDLFHKLRQSSNIPILLLSASDNQQEKVSMLLEGADDFISKPFNPEEIHARIQVALRRCVDFAGHNNNLVITFDDISLDLHKHSLAVNGKDVHLTPTEFKLLKCLALSPGKAISFKRLFQEVQANDIQGDPVAYLRVYIMQLRKKIEPDPGKPKYIIAVPRHGYLLQAKTSGTS
jgi:two-component system KDP operon response regulator KdpE